MIVSMIVNNRRQPADKSKVTKYAMTTLQKMQNCIPKSHNRLARSPFSAGCRTSKIFFRKERMFILNILRLLPSEKRYQGRCRLCFEFSKVIELFECSVEVEKEKRSFGGGYVANGFWRAAEVYRQVRHADLR